QSACASPLAAAVPPCQPTQNGPCPCRRSAMAALSDTPQVTAPDGRWRGDWADGYAVVLTQHDAARPVSYWVVLDVSSQGRYLTTLTVDLLSARSRQEFAVAMGALNGVAPVVWDTRLAYFYHELMQAQARLAGPPWPPPQALPSLLPAVPALPVEMLP